MASVIWEIRLPFPLAGKCRAGEQALSSLTDESLMTRYRDGDADAFEELYRRHRGGLHRFVRRMIPSQVDEVFQEVWLAVVAGKARYLPSARFRTYLFAIAHHRCAARLRIMYRDTTGEVQDELLAIDDSAGPLEVVVNAELGRALEDALAQLPPLQREAFLMQAEGGLSLEEIAEITGTGRETVKSRLRYALRKLRGALESWQ